MRVFESEHVIVVPVHAFLTPIRFNRYPRQCHFVIPSPWLLTSPKATVASVLNLYLLLSDPNLQTAVLSCLRMVVCVHTPLQEVAEIMTPTSADVNNTGNRSMPQTNSSVYDSSSSSAVMSPELQVPPESPWLIQWCIHAINRRENSLVVRLEALQVLGSFVKSYVFLLRYAV